MLILSLYVVCSLHVVPQHVVGLQPMSIKSRVLPGREEKRELCMVKQPYLGEGLEKC